MGKRVRDQDTPLCKNQIVKKKVLDSPGGKQNYSSNPPPLGKFSNTIMFISIYIENASVENVRCVA